MDIKQSIIKHIFAVTTRARVRACVQSWHSVRIV